MSDKDNDYSAIEKMIDSLSSKMDNLTNIAMSMNNEIARLDERVTFALEQQKEHSSDIQRLKERVNNAEASISKLENANSNDIKARDNQKSFMGKVYLAILSAFLTGVLTYIFMV